MKFIEALLAGTEKVWRSKLIRDNKHFYLTLLGTIQILRKHSEWVGGVIQMLMLYAKPEHFTSEVCLQGVWVGQEMVQNMFT